MLEVPCCRTALLKAQNRTTLIFSTAIIRVCLFTVHVTLWIVKHMSWHMNRTAVSNRLAALPSGMIASLAFWYMPIPNSWNNHLLFKPELLLHHWTTTAILWRVVFILQHLWKWKKVSGVCTENDALQSTWN